jgi:uncharacterized protein (TIGR03086 family)
MGPIEQLDVILPTVSDLVDRIASDQLTEPTPCSEFTVHDVLDHMIVLGGSFAHLFRGEEPPAITAPPVYGRVPAAELRAAMDDLLEAVKSEQAMQRTLDTPIGQMDGATFASVVAFDGLIHGWDLAAATGQIYEVDREVVEAVDAFARAALGDDLRSAGLFAAPTEVPADASTIEALAAFSGRSVDERWRTPASPIRIEKEAIPTKMEVPGATARQLLDFGDATGYGKIAAEYFTLAAGTDIAPLLQGLDHDACHAPHWGYMLDGEVVVTFVGGRESTFCRGEMFYWPAGHRVRVLEDAEMILFSPQDEHVAVIDHMLDKLAAG